MDKSNPELKPESTGSADFENRISQIIDRIAIFEIEGGRFRYDEEYGKIISRLAGAEKGPHVLVEKRRQMDLIMAEYDKSGRSKCPLSFLQGVVLEAAPSPELGARLFQLVDENPGSLLLAAKEVGELITSGEKRGKTLATAIVEAANFCDDDYGGNVASRLVTDIKGARNRLIHHIDKLAGAEIAETDQCHKRNELILTMVERKLAKDDFRRRIYEARKGDLNAVENNLLSGQNNLDDETSRYVAACPYILVRFASYLDLLTEGTELDINYVRKLLGIAEISHRRKFQIS